MRLKQGFREHVWADVAVIDAVERVQLDRVTFEMSGKKSRIDAEARMRTFPLHVVEENGDVRNIFAGHAAEEKLVHEDLAEPVFAARLHGANHSYEFSSLNDKIVLKAHGKLRHTWDDDGDVDGAGSAIDSLGDEEQLNEALEEVAVDLPGFVRLSGPE